MKNTLSKTIEDVDWIQAKKLKDEVSHFLKEQYNFILLKDNVQTVTDSVSFIDKFIIEPSREPLFQKLCSPGELKNLISYIDKSAKDMQDSIGKILDEYEQKLNKDLSNTIDMIFRLTQIFRKTLESRSKKFSIIDVITVSEMQEAFYQFLKNILDGNLIERIIPAIYEGMKNGNIKIYELILRPINIFLSELGVCTLNVTEKQQINYDICSPLQSDDNKTNDYKLKEIIKEVRQLPYVFDKEHLVSEGKVVVWRFINE